MAACLPVHPPRRQVPDFNAMYELYDPCTVMFFFRNKVGRPGGGWGERWQPALGPCTVMFFFRNKVPGCPGGHGGGWLLAAG